MQYPDDFENFWVQYGEKGTSKGPKREAYKSWQKVKAQWMKEEHETSPVEFSRHVRRGIMAIQANRKAAREANQFVPQWPMATTFLNQWRFEEELATPTSEYRQATVERTCSCGNTNTIGRSETGGWICEACYLKDWKKENTLQPMIDKYPRQDGESWPEWSRRVYGELKPELKRRLKNDQ